MTMEMEEHGRVIDFMPEGRSMDRMREPTAQLLGERYFTLLEVSIKRDAKVALGQSLYIGKAERPEVEKIKRRIEYFELTATAKNELAATTRQIIHDREADFVSFFNKAGPISMRLHQIELLPGIGRKHLAEILDARGARQFENFEDIKKRVPLLPDPTGLLITRIEEELAGSSNHYLFVRPPAKRQEGYQ